MIVGHVLLRGLSHITPANIHLVSTANTCSWRTQLYGQITTCTHKWCRCRYSVSPRMTGNRRKYGKAFAGSSIFILTCGSQKVTQWSFETYLESFLPVCLSIIRFQLTYSNYYCLVLLAYCARNNNYPSASGALLVGSGLVLSGFIEGHVSMSKYCKLY